MTCDSLDDTLPMTWWTSRVRKMAQLLLLFVSSLSVRPIQSKVDLFFQRNGRQFQHNISKIENRTLIWTHQLLIGYL